MQSYEHDGLSFTFLEYGAQHVQTVVLLHGFPATAESWEPVAKKLAARGFRVLVPEQRGYAPGARPKRRSAYTLSALTGDIAALLDATGVQKAHIVGHDWGGAVAWAFASWYPERTLTLAAISSPHPKALSKSLFASDQLRRSWYMLFFQLPYLPERLLLRPSGKSGLENLAKTGLTKQVAEKYAAYMRGGRLTGALNWYRALPLAHKPVGHVAVPTLHIYGQKDAYLSPKSAELTQQFADGAYTFLEWPEASHWMPEESPERLTDTILSFVNGVPPIS